MRENPVRGRVVAILPELSDDEERAMAKLQRRARAVEGFEVTCRKTLAFFALGTMYCGRDEDEALEFLTNFVIEADALEATDLEEQRIGVEYNKRLSPGLKRTTTHLVYLHKFKRFKIPRGACLGMLREWVSCVTRLITYEDLKT